MAQQLAHLDRSLAACEQHPSKIVQFGTGNFLKGFINAIVHQLNERNDLDAGIVAVKLRRGNEEQIERINHQQGLFTLNVRGFEDNTLVDHVELITCQNSALSPYTHYEQFLSLARLSQLQWIVSNTTEAGICFDANDRFQDTPPSTFPAKLTQLLYHRYRHYKGDSNRGLALFCCELIDDNASVLRDHVLKYSQQWKLEDAFCQWVIESCQFYNTLVDRIVTGKPSPQRLREIQSTLRYQDEQIIEAESYYQWVIEAPVGKDQDLKRWFPESANLNILLTSNLAPYRQRKVRILNGAHTGCVALAALLGIESVYEATQDTDLMQFMQRLVYEEICPTVDLPIAEVTTYADAILERFANPYLHHQWQSIALNSFSKWQARLLPVLIAATDNGKTPPALASSLAYLLLLYRGDSAPQGFQIQDDEQILVTVKNAWKTSADVSDVVAKVFGEAGVWPTPLVNIPGLVEAISHHLRSIEQQGLRKFLQS